MTYFFTSPELSVSEFLDQVAALILPPRKYRYRYFGVLAPNSRLRALVVLQAGRKPGAGSKVPRQKTVRTYFCALWGGHPARYLWAQLLARIYGMFVLKCSLVRQVAIISPPAMQLRILHKSAIYVGRSVLRGGWLSFAANAAFSPSAAAAIWLAGAWATLYSVRQVW